MPVLLCLCVRVRVARPNVLGLPRARGPVPFPIGLALGRYASLCEAPLLAGIRARITCPCGVTASLFTGACLGEMFPIKIMEKLSVAGSRAINNLCTCQETREGSWITIMKDVRTGQRERKRFNQ